MQVEEDPSSQFVDFTNATDSEQFVSDIEQALIAWQLSNKGHASLEALSASSSSVPNRPNWTNPKRPNASSDPFIWTRDLQAHPAGQSSPKSYVLTLFVARHPEHKTIPGEDPPASGCLRMSYKLKKWQEGLEHFTPTMLSVADTNRDFQWGVDGEMEEDTETLLETETEDTNETGRTSTYYTSVFEDDGEAVLSKKMVFSNVQKWFGVDEFLFLSRSSPRERKTQRQQEQSHPPTSSAGLSEKTEREEENAKSAGNEQLHKEAEVDNETDDASGKDEDAIADIQVDQNEAGMLLSALTMALNNCNCTIPAFVPVLEPSRGTWMGSAVPGATGNVSISFDTDSVPELNPNQSCISGLLDFFKLKLQLPPHIEERYRVEADESGDLAIGMMVSASFGYSWIRADDPREMTPENPLVSAATWKGTDVEDIRHIVLEFFGEEEENDDEENGGSGQGLKGSSTPSLAILPGSVQHGAPLGELVSILATRMGQLHGINSMSLLWVEFVKALRDRKQAPMRDWLPFESPVDPLQTGLPAEGRGVWWFERHGMLSERMRFGQGHEHLWQQMWDTSVPLPASRQKRLFDPLQESEKIYHYMETLSPHELFHQMLAGSISSSVFALETTLPVRTSADTLPVVHRALQKLHTRGNRAIALLDEALAESQVAFPASGRSRRETGQNEQSRAAAHQNQQLQVAFEMALDASWKLVRTLEAVEVLITKALALLHYFSAPNLEQSALALVNLLLLPSLSHRQQVEISGLLKQEHLRQYVATLVLTNSTLAEAGPMSTPVQREYVLRCVCPRPFLREYYGETALDEDEGDMSATQPDQELEESPLVVSRMYAAFKKSTMRFALVLAESEF
ncbi:hypothetical protein BBJ29_004808 [Phytophthora kernoviae]|uniref:Rab3 GTPase-activating protein catalytic subunit n=1 Tax=Phytophthora kernoviae TaxID=325452 RepID=A0A3F2S3J2_9STRA|nr:hypothetical protein BBJ29_004808 [Phytophthora kernoviae]RLN69568.1 hypothetical protein BBP00_00000212 [Phytophthora kernoviae]